MPTKFTSLSSAQFKNSISSKLIPVADRLRDLLTKTGQRPYKVRIVRTSWSGGVRGVGEEIVTRELEIQPTPRVSDLNQVAEIVLPHGLEEIGSVLLSGVSGRYTEEDLRGLEADGTPPGADEQVFYEIEFPRLDGQAGQKRRFFIKSAPSYKADKLQWTVLLEKSHDDRHRQGDLR